MSSDSIPQIASALVVDDSSVQRNHGVALCRELGIATIYEASNGREALALLTGLETRPSVLILDLEMPTMDGTELLEQLQQRGVDIPVIVASSRERNLIDAVHVMGSIIGVHILGALQKPLRADTLAAALRNFGSQAAQRRNTELPIDANALRQAIEQAEIQVHYQPKIDIRTGIVRGMEALARWRHPTLGLVPPDQFIPLAERSDLIHALTIQVMNQAMMQTADWQAHGLHLSIAINLSPLLLDQSSITQDISSLQQGYGLAAEQIIFEVTENSLATRPGVALGVLARLRLRGFGLAIDDYGTGFSSMQQLARIPFTELKIDRSFVHGANERENARVILRSALDMANELGLSTVAEGVETEQDWRLLVEFGCTLAQGYLIAKPMSGDEVSAWVKHFRRHKSDLYGTAPPARGADATKPRS